MKIGRVFPDLLTPLGTATSLEEGLGRTLRRLLASTHARAGALAFSPPRGAPIVLAVGATSRPAALERWLLERVTPVAGMRLTTVAPPGGRARRPVALLRAPLGPAGRPVGTLALLGSRRAITRATLPSGFPRELGAAIEQVWRLHQQTLRITVLNELMQLLVSGHSTEDVVRAFMEGLARLVPFDAVNVLLVDPERGDFEIVGEMAHGAVVPPSQTRVPLADTLLEQMMASGAPVHVHDVTSSAIPAASRARLAGRGYRAAVLVPLAAGGEVFGAVGLASARDAAFDPTDVATAAELARPLASALEQRRLLEESGRQSETLAALLATSRLITSRLDLSSVLDRISRSVTGLIGGTGCGIALLDEAGARLVQAASHGVSSDEWRALAVSVGEGIIGHCAATGLPICVHDVRTDPRSARREVDEREGIRSLLCVPLRGGGSLLGVISVFSPRSAAFTPHHQRVLEAFAEQAGVAIHNARLFEESVRRAGETRALVEAARAVTATLDPERTIRVILEQGRRVLNVDSCGLLSLDPVTRELTMVASLDLPPDMISRIRFREGQGITGLAVLERRPVQSQDLLNDPRVQTPEVARASGFRSMLSVPLCVSDTAIGAITILRNDPHHFSSEEEAVLVALADQAAIALEHARLYQRLEGMVAERTRELDRQKRFVEVVLERLPLGVFVLDPGQRLVRVNGEGVRLCGAAAQVGASVADVLLVAVPLVHDAVVNGRGGTTTEELTLAGETRVLRLTAAPFDPEPGAGRHAVLMVEDVTRAKQLERQMLLTERLTTAGRLAAGVAHELNNPLATIAGCAEALQTRLREHERTGGAEPDDFPTYLALIEEEAYRCKEITGSLLQFVREPGSRRAPTDLNALVTKAMELLSHQSRFTESRVVGELAPDLALVSVNEGQLRQVFLGVAANALEAMEGRGQLTVRTRTRRGHVEIEFEDEGPGIPDEVLARIFDPFFTTKPPGQGTGLGLAIAQGIVADHDGRIEVTSRVGKGTTFRVIVPV
jgi:GAF domain-containing protein/nitrogen-specific signal transduction histidine kinase